MSSPAVEAAARLLGPFATRGGPLRARTTYPAGGTAALFFGAPQGADLRRARTASRFGGPGALFVAAREGAALRPVRRAVRETTPAVLVIGKGSTMLVADTGFGGLALPLGDGLAEIDIDASAARVTAGGGRSL